MNKAIWITWENQIRNKSMASMLGARLYVIINKSSRLTRYCICAFKTLLILFKERPKIVFAQNPSFVLNYFLIFAKLLFGFKLVSDAHYAGVMASHVNSIHQKLLDICNKLVDLVIVTNPGHATYIHDIGGNAVICEDPLPDISNFFTKEASDKKIVFYICSFDIDEPYDQAFRSAELLADDNFTFIVSGNYNKVNINPSSYPHVHFLGYVSQDEYYKQLFQCSVVLDLTENDNCLLCGAYEAMAAEKPLITSDTDTLRMFFTSGTLFTKHTKESIAFTIKQAYSSKDIYKNEIREWKKYIVEHQKKRVLEIYSILHQAVPADCITT